jgi:antirestriction protein ArdC
MCAFFATGLFHFGKTEGFAMATISTSTTPRVDVYSRVTSRIVEELERGVRPWLKPWNAEHAAGRITRPLRHNGQPYKGINILMLWASAEIAGYACPIWLTFQQAKELGGHVKKGEHGSPVVYASTFKKTDKTEDGQEIEEEIPFLKEWIGKHAPAFAQGPI